MTPQDMTAPDIIPPTPVTTGDKTLFKPVYIQKIFDNYFNVVMSRGVISGYHNIDNNCSTNNYW